jgi:hypothetical protein
MFRRWWWVFLVVAGIGAASGVIEAGIVIYINSLSVFSVVISSSVVSLPRFTPISGN